MKTLSDVPVTPLEIVDRLAALAPKKEEPPASVPQKRASGVANPPRRRDELGSLILDKYLPAYGVQYSVKDSSRTPGKTIYRLDHCLFDPSHTKNEASIVQDSTGKITYQCFHDSCKAKTWADARRMISQKDKLAKFCEGYQENWKGPASREPSSGMLANIEIESQGGQMVAVPTVPSPRDIDPLEFFEQTGNRSPHFVPARMAKYYAAYLKHLVHTAGAFWWFDQGVWKRFSEYELNKICVDALGEKVQPPHLKGTIEVSRGLLNREEPEWPTSGRYVNCLDGMINIETGKLEPHDPRQGSRTQVPCHFNFDAACPRWMRFLEEIFPEDPLFPGGSQEKQDLLQKFMGYCLLADNRFEKALFMYGDGGNGKGTVLHVLRAMVGPENTSSLSMRDLGDPKFSVYFLQGKLVNVATETTARDPLATEMFKTIVSGEPVTCEMKFGNKFQFVPYVKFVIAMNEVPIIPDKTYGFERRLLVLGFNQRFEGEKKDVLLKEKLLAELDGIFVWALMGLEALLKAKDFAIGASVAKERSDFLKELNPVTGFFDEALEADPRDMLGVLSVYKTYQKWCKDNGHRALTRTRFNRELLKYFPSATKDKAGKARNVYFIGLTAKIDLESA